MSPDATHNETRFAPLATERGAEGRTEGQLLQLGALRTEGMNGELGRRLDGVCRAARAHLGRVRARVRARARVRVRVRVRVGDGVRVGVGVGVGVSAWEDVAYEGVEGGGVGVRQLGERVHAEGLDEHLLLEIWGDMGRCREM